MKNLFKTAYLLVVAAFAAISCAPEEYVPGKQDLKNCYGVYFPAQSSISKLELSPDEPTEVTITAMRLKEDDAITVPVIITGSEKGIFSASEIKFEDGQTETTFKVSFPNAKVGVSYTCDIVVKDPQYALIYGVNNTFISFSVTRIKWNKLEATDGKVGKWRDDFLSSWWVPAGFNEGGQYLETDIEVYERDDKKGYYRIDNVYTEEYLTAMLVPGLKVAHEAFDNSIFIDATNPNKVTFDGVQYLGVEIEGYKARIFPFTSDYVNTETDYYGTLTDGIITFPKSGLLMDADGSGSLGYVNYNGMFRIILPGHKAYDYKVVLEAGESDEGVIPVRFELGANISKVKYNVYEGSLTPAEISAKAKEIEADDKADAVTESGVVGLNLGKTGIYTIVTANIDDQGKCQSSNSKQIKYVAAEESMPVVLTTGLIVSDKNAAQGYTSENSVEFYIFGKDIEKASMGLYTAMSLAKDPESIVKELQGDSKALSSDILAKINSNGYTGLIGNLNSGTEYVLVVLASNGYESKIFTANATTNGEPDPKQATYTFEDISPAKSPADYFKTWNYYAENYDEPAGREFIGSVTIEDGEDYQDDPADYILVKGIFGNDAKDLGMDDTMEFEYYSGVIYTLANVFNPVTLGTDKYYPGTMYLADPLDYSGMYNGALLGGLVDEGWLAFVDYGFGADSGVGFGPIALGLFADEGYETYLGWYSAYDKILLVDSEIDDAEAAAPARKSSLTKNDLKKISYEYSKSINYIETPSGSMKSAIDRILANKGVRDYAKVANNIKVTYKAQPASFEVIEGVEFVPARGDMKSCVMTGYSIIK